MAGSRRRVRRAAAGVMMAAAALLVISGLRLFSWPPDRADAARWRDSVIPLPKELAVEGVLRLEAGDITVINEAGEGPLLETTVGILRGFAAGRPGEAEFELVLALTGPGGRVSKSPDSPRLRGLPNPGQAYSVSPLPDRRGLLLAANAPLGLLYAARTLEQLTKMERAKSGESIVVLPLARIVDWPDIAERGQWGGDAAAQLEVTSRLKLNHLEIDSGVTTDAAGRPAENLDRDLLRRGASLGVKIVPYILHLEQISRYAGLAGRPDITATPDPSKPLPSDYAPGLCLTSPVTRGAYPRLARPDRRRRRRHGRLHLAVGGRRPVLLRAVPRPRAVHARGRGDRRGLSRGPEGPSPAQTAPPDDAGQLSRSTTGSSPPRRRISGSPTTTAAGPTTPRAGR